MKAKPSLPLECFGYVRPRAGYHQAGDATYFGECAGGVLLALVDVLGHGPEAHEVAVKAMLTLKTLSDAQGPAQVLMALHEALKGTRGAATGIALLDVATGHLRYAGVGNTTIRRFGAVASTGADRLISADGIVGANMRTPREHHMTLSAGDLVIMHSDGVSERFELSDCPQLVGQDTAAIARTIVRLFGKDYDDAACLAVRWSR